MMFKILKTFFVKFKNLPPQAMAYFACCLPLIIIIISIITTIIIDDESSHHHQCSLYSLNKLCQILTLT